MASARFLCHEEFVAMTALEISLFLVHSHVISEASFGISLVVAQVAAKHSHVGVNLQAVTVKQVRCDKTNHISTQHVHVGTCTFTEINLIMYM